MEKTFAGGSKTAKFVKVFSLESVLLYSSLSKNNTMVDLNLAVQYRIAITNRQTQIRHTGRFYSGSHEGRLPN